MSKVNILKVATSVRNQLAKLSPEDRVLVVKFVEKDLAQPEVEASEALNAL